MIFRSEIERTGLRHGFEVTGRNGDRGLQFGPCFTDPAKLAEGSREKNTGNCSLRSER
jgi:hypothetical protein